MKKPKQGTMTIVLPKNTKDAAEVAARMMEYHRAQIEKEKELQKAYEDGFNHAKRNSIFPFPF